MQRLQWTYMHHGQHGHGACMQQGHATRTCSMDMRHEHAAYDMRHTTCGMYLKQEFVACTCSMGSMDLRRVNAVKACNKGMQHVLVHATWACSMGSKEMKHGRARRIWGMDMHHVHAACACSVHAAIACYKWMQHGHSAWACSMYVHVVWTFNMNMQTDMKRVHGVRVCSESKQQEHAASSCSMGMKHGAAWKIQHGGQAHPADLAQHFTTYNMHTYNRHAQLTALGFLCKIMLPIWTDQGKI